MNFKLWEIFYTTNNVLNNVFCICEDRNQESQKDTERFWLATENNPFYDWLEKNSVNFKPGNLPGFADGGIGRAYFLGDKVVKFTKNRVEANVAKAAIGQNTPTAIIDVWRAPGLPLWAILQKYVNVNIEKELKIAADIATAIMDDLKEENPNFTSFPINPQEQEKLAAEAVRKYNQPTNLIPYIISAMNAINQLYFKTGFTHDDAGPTNIGRDFQTGKIVFHDLGPNVTKNFKSRPILNKIHKNREQLGLSPLAEV
jgi:hypothetical protein